MNKLGLWGRLLLLALVPSLFLESLRLSAGAPFTTFGFVGRWGFAAGVLLGAVLTRPERVSRSKWCWPGVFWLIPGLGGGLIYSLSGATWSAWLLVGTAYILLLNLETMLTGNRVWFRRWAWRSVLAGIAGLFPAALSQVESRFADEEFFVALEALALALFWFLLLWAYWLGFRSRLALVRRGVRVDWRVVSLIFCVLVFGGLNGTVWAYRHSFYPPIAPMYPGISWQSPFICGQVPPDGTVYDGLDVFRRILALVEKNPRKGTPEYGMLALGTGDRRWAEAFRESLLAEAAEGRYTGPAHSVKSVQFEAALRAYYYPRVRKHFPGLFSEAEDRTIRAWFAAINRRTLTVEWVDLMYALAFSKWPEGPYENQENGAGLLALLEAEGLAEPGLSATNRAYLARNRRGWVERFRVTDDAIIYQPVWIFNAYFQALYTGEFPEENARRSFEWLLLQALPDGGPLRYNHPGRVSLAGVAYLGAKLFEDPRYIWLAGRAVEYAEQEGKYLFAQPGVEEPIPLKGRSPVEGTCLLYGDSGLPNQKGPLAPDKIVFRDGWGKDATYLLVNLRFTGWHRYKATGTVTLLYKEEALVADALEGHSFSWLPVGRSLFRDKRIPREDLNGLVVEKTGMAAVLYMLTGIGSRWAQDPPYYAEVVAFETGKTVDWAQIRVVGWRGWVHTRWVYFYHSGPIAVIDHAEGPKNSRAALVWHLTGGEPGGGNRFRLTTGTMPAEMVLLFDQKRNLKTEVNGGHAWLTVKAYGQVPGTLHGATLFLPDGWTGARVELQAAGIRIEGPGGRVTIPLPVEVRDG